MANGTLAASQIEMLTQSGTGIVTIVPPTTNTNRTLTLPDSTGTLLNTNGGTITGNLTVSGIATLANNAVLGVPSSGTLTNLTGLPLTTGVTGTLPVANGGTGITSFGSGVATFLGTPSSANLIAAITDETGTGALVFANTPTLVTPLLGTPTSGVATNLTGLPLTTGVTGVLPTANGGTNLSSFTSGGVVFASSSSVLATGSVFTFNGTNVGLGAALSAWDTFTGSFQIAGASLSGLGANNTALASNAYYQSAWKYYGTASASLYQQNAGQHAWSVAGSGTAGNAITFTQAMTLDASGNLGIGTASPSSFTVGGTPILVVGNNAQTQITLYGGSSTGDINFATSNSGAGLYKGVVRYDGTSNFMSFWTNSAEKMRLDSSGNLGLGITSVATGISQRVLQVTNGTNGMILLGSGATQNPNPRIFGASTYDLALAAGVTTGQMLFYTNDTQRMTLDASGNLGVGTSSPTQKLDVFGADNANLIISRNSNGSSSMRIQSNAAASYIVSAGAIPLIFDVNSSERARIDSSGNLGLGVTPSAFYSTYRVLEGASGALYFRTDTVNDSGFMANSYRDTSAVYRFKQNGAATYYSQGAGTHQFFTSTSSGTAGDAITFTQAMTLNASGNLGIGTSSPAYRVTSSVSSTSTLITSFTNDNIVFSGVNTGTATANQLVPILFRYADGTYNGNSIITALRESATGRQQSFVFAPSNSSGDPTERARIDSSGNLLVGTTATSVTGSTGFRYLGGGRIAVTDAASTDATTTYEAYSTGAGAFRFYVGLGGTIFATSTVITAISDQRLKENVRDIDTGLDAIMALKPRRFDWKEGKGQDKKDVAGFIAQEFETVFPECVSTSKAGADGIEYKNINHETLIPTLVKAMQEQQALITQLTARITALETP